MSQRKPKAETLRRLRKFKAEWRDQVMYDGKLRSAVRLVLWDMAKYVTMNDTALRFEKRTVVVIFPSQQNIAEALKIHPSTVSNAIGTAIKRKHLVQQVIGTGFTGPSKYQLVLHERKRKAESVHRETDDETD